MSHPLHVQLQTIRQNILTIRIMRAVCSQYGIEEWAGSAHNPEVLKYFKAAGHSTVKDDETSWCAAKMNWIALQAGCKRTMSLLARDWLKLGQTVALEQAVPFLDYAVFWRVKPDGWQGHVGPYIAHNHKVVYVMGGNQSNRVNVTGYPRTQLLGIRRMEEE